MTDIALRVVQRYASTVEVKRYEIPDDGIAWVVVRTPYGHSVVMFDTDENEPIGGARKFPKSRFPTDEEAVDYAYKQAKKSGYRGRR